MFRKNQLKEINHAVALIPAAERSIPRDSNKESTLANTPQLEEELHIEEG